MIKHWFIIIFLFLIACSPKPKQESHQMTKKSLDGYWYQQPLRILQTVLRETDGENYNVDSLIQYMNRSHSNVLVVNGGGIVDFFQNTLSMANVNPYIGKRDLLAEIVNGCHEAGIKVIARVDFRGVEKERYDLHPDWFARDEKGEPILVRGNIPVLYAPCYNGYYRTEHSVEFISLLMEKYHLDGIWHNAVNFHNVCYCDICKKKYYDEYQKKIPVTGAPESEWDEYYRWNEKMASNQLELMRKTVKKYGEDKSYAAEVFDMYGITSQKHSGISLYSAAKYFDFFVTVSFLADNRVNVEYKDIYYPSAIVRFLKSLEPDKAPVILFGGNGTEHRYIYEPPLDSRLWLWEAAGTGGGFWNCYFNGSTPTNTMDTRNAYMESDSYKYIRDNEVLVRRLQPVTDVAIFYSKASGEMLGDADFSLPLKGTIRLLEEKHYQYGFVTDINITKEKLSQFKVLIMPDVAALSDDHASIIREWVKDGGKLIATFQTSLFDETGKMRKDFSMSDLFGVNYNGSFVNTEMDCYQKIILRDKILAGFEKTMLLHNGGRTLMVNPSLQAKVITGYLPKINNQPPEFAFPGNWDSPSPIMVMNSFGKGQVVYFANEVDKLNYTIGHPDYSNLISNSINILLDNIEVLQTNAPASVHVYLNQNSDDKSVYQLSLVNTSSSSLRPLRDLVPVSGITIHLPFKVKSCDPLWDAKNTKVKVDGNTLVIDNLNEFVSLKLNI